MPCSRKFYMNISNSNWVNYISLAGQTDRWTYSNKKKNIFSLSLSLSLSLSFSFYLSHSLSLFQWFVFVFRKERERRDNKIKLILNLSFPNIIVRYQSIISPMQLWGQESFSVVPCPWVVSWYIKEIFRNKTWLFHLDKGATKIFAIKGEKVVTKIDPRSRHLKG